MLHRLALPLAILALAPASASAAGWLASSPVPLSSEVAWQSQIAIADSGRGAVAWLEGTINNRVMVATYQHGSGVSGAVPLATQNLNSRSGPVVAVSPKGDTVVAWRASTPTIMAATRQPDAESFTPATGIVTTTDVSGPLVAALDDGTLEIAWIDGTGVRLAVRHPGDAAFTTTTVPDPGTVHSIALAAAPGGGAALAITDALNGEGRLMLSIAPAGGSFATPFKVVSVDASAGYELQDVGLAYGPGGKLGIAFAEHLNGAGEVYGLTGDANGDVGFPYPIPDSTWTTVRDVRVSFASDGSESIAYLGVSGATPKGRLAVASPSGSWSTVPVWPAGVFPGAVRVAPLGSRFVALSGSSDHGLAGGLVPDLSPLGTVAQGDAVDSIAVHGADAVATVTHQEDGAFHVEALTWDGTPPAISELTPPADATVGVPAAFHVSASDALSATSIKWSFGDGSTATGDGVTHAFAAAGTFTVTATATDGAGNTSTRSVDVSVAVPAAPPATKLQFLSAKLNRTHTLVRWSLNLPASVSATIKRGTRTIAVAKRRAGMSGSARLVRAHGRPLRRGRYRIVLRARDTSGRLATRTIKLRVR